MSETIWSFRVGGSIAGRALAYGFIAFLALLLLLVALTSPPQYRLNNALGMAIFLAPLIAAPRSPEVHPLHRMVRPSQRPNKPQLTSGPLRYQAIDAAAPTPQRPTL